jgi:Trk K+ transport system NAD-binding subunit
LQHVRWVVSTVPDLKLNIGLIQALRERHYAGRIAVAVHSEKEEAILASMGADRVLSPHRDAADFAASVICAR